MLALDIEWIGPTYEAGLEGDRVEWPPHPARVFCALVSVAEPGSADDDALRWLELQDPPSIQYPRAVTSVLRSYVPTNATGGGKGDTSQQYVARTNGERTWPRALPEVSFARMVWPHPEPAPAVAARLAELARRVPYLGRATSPVLLSFSDTLIEADLDELEPASTGSSLLRAPYRGYLDALRAAHAGRQRATTADRLFAYRTPSPPLPEPDHVSPAYPDLVTLGFAPGGIDGRHALPVARAWKAAVLQRLGTPEPDDPWRGFTEAQLALVHGHHDGRLRQVAFVTLPYVDARHATGYLKGVGVCLSRDIGPDVRRALLQLLGFDRETGPRLTSLFVPGLARFPLYAADGRQTIDARTWQRAASRWDSVFPIVLDRWPKRSHTPAEIIADGCEMAGYPRPVDVEVRRMSAVAGAPWISRAGTRRPRPGPSRPAVHAVVTFGVPVPGPVVLGHLRHLGLGLCRPRDEEHE